MLCFNLAKNHMVAKPEMREERERNGFNLAKNHMVAKLGTS